jgi:hypothetical protein
MDETNNTELLQTNLDTLTENQLRNLLIQYKTEQKLGLYWERNQIEHDKALNSDQSLNYKCWGSYLRKTAPYTFWCGNYKTFYSL